MKLDYWPFDYDRYIHEILPALRFATEGQLELLQQLVNRGQQEQLPFSPPWALSAQGLSPHAIATEKLSPLLEKYPRLSFFFRPSQEPAEASPVPFSTYSLSWELLQEIVPTLADCRFGQAFPLAATLHLGVVYAFCCAPFVDHTVTALFENAEAMAYWRDYFEQDEQIQELSCRFYQPVPVNLAHVLRSPVGTREHSPAHRNYVGWMSTLLGWMENGINGGPSSIHERYFPLAIPLLNRKNGQNIGVWMAF